jgi:hypothetical protein
VKNGPVRRKPVLTGYDRAPAACGRRAEVFGTEGIAFETIVGGGRTREIARLPAHCEIGEFGPNGNDTRGRSQPESG